MRKKIAIFITLIIIIVTSAILLFNFVTGPKVNLLLQQETEAENLWKSKGINNYFIQLKYELISPYTDIQIHKITIKNSKVVTYENACQKSRFSIDSTKPCIKQEIKPEEYIVPSLFTLAKLATNYNVPSGSVYPTSLRYDNDFGYPLEISFNKYQILHGHEIWTVESFQILN